MKRIIFSNFFLFTLSLIFATSAFAYSENNISHIVNVRNNGQYFTIGEIMFSEDRRFNDHFQNGDIFTIALPSGVSWNPDSIVNAANADIRLVSSRLLEVTMKNCEDGITDSIVLKGLQIKVESNFTGDIKLEIDGMDSAITGSKSISEEAPPVKKYYNEVVTVLKALDDSSALIGRENGEQYIIETEDPLEFRILEKKPVIVLSPSSFFAGPGSYLQVSTGNQSLIIDVIQLNSKVTNTGDINSAKINIFINGEEVSFDTQPIVDAGITLVPLRGIMEKLGAEVTYHNASETIIVTKGTQETSLKIGDLQAKVNYKIVNLQLPAQVVKNRTLVPLRFISESLGAAVDYNKQEGFISIY